MIAVIAAGQLQKKRAATAARCAMVRKMTVPQFIARFVVVSSVWFPDFIQNVLDTYRNSPPFVSKHIGRRSGPFRRENYKSRSEERRVGKECRSVCAVQ